MFLSDFHTAKSEMIPCSSGLSIMPLSQAKDERVQSLLKAMEGLFTSSGGFIKNSGMFFNVLHYLILSLLE